MLYSSAGFLALLINLIINHDVLWGNFDKERIPSHHSYRMFLIAVTIYYVTDICWGLLYEHGLTALCSLDTTLYFIAMAFSILYWMRYVIDYLREDTDFGRILAVSGNLIFAFQMAVVFINFFRPILFSFDGAGNYHAETARYVTLILQIFMFLITAVYALIVTTKSSGTMKLRHRTIGLFSLAMSGFAIAQAYFPLLPLYSLGCLLGSCLLHSFVLENEKEEYRETLENRLQDSILKGNYYDLLTGLPGMSHFFDIASKKRSEMLENGDKPAFLFLNLSGLKFYNQSHGFAEGDRLLRSFAHLLISVFGEDQCSRFGQDHFAVLTRESVLKDALARLFSQWADMNNHDCPAILVGVYLDSVSGLDITSAYDAAKIACDDIEVTYVSSFRFFDNDMYAMAEKRQYILAHLEQALNENWVQVYYQPIVRAINERVCDEEALARWIDPNRGFLSPADFIPILEDAKLIYKLDLYIVEQVLDKLRRTREAGLILVPQSINLSRSDFEVCDIVEEIRRRVDDAGFSRQLITIEITESILGSDPEFIRQQVERFRDLGFPVWMDDFGSGYSSLDVLQSMPVDLIKFDMRFMQQFNHGKKNKIILTELVKLAIGLGIDTVCEGIERVDQAEFLREIGCAKLQGFHYGKPIPFEQVLERYEKGIQIGFENPEESDYYDAIGRINLYDLAVITQDEEGAFGQYFNTIPMAVIEVRGNKARFTRTNQAYRDFIEKVFHVGYDVLSGPFEETPEGPGLPFVMMLRKCCAEGGRMLFRETMPDGSTVHSFMRRIAENPSTNTIAAAVAVLAIIEGNSVPVEKDRHTH